ncbi:MAG: ABC transporter ATP-binding protein [Dehalococcoidia bacterium]
MAELAIRVQGLRKTYGQVVAVDDVSFAVERGEIFGIIGPNGSGKTTSVECLQGLRTPDGGELDVLGLDPGTEANALRHRIGSQLQESALPDRMRVWEALDLFGALTPHGRVWEPVCREWGLWEKRDAAFANLSGGQRQRLFIALALVGNPELVFLDEMTTGLDPTARRATWELIRKVREGGATVVLVTHFMDEAESLCDRVAVFRQGRVAALDTPRALVSEFAGRMTVTFTASEDVGFLGECPGAEAVEREGPRVSVRGHGALLAHVGAALVARGIEPLDLDVDRGTLEEVFLALTEGPQA